MNSLRAHPIGFFIALCLVFSAHAQNATLRITCEGESANAEISINGDVKGPCPIDISVTAGNIKLRAVRQVNATMEQIHEEEFRLGSGVVKRQEIVLGRPQLNAQGRRVEQERVAFEQAAMRRQQAEAMQQKQERERLQAEAKRKLDEALGPMKQAADRGDASAMVVIGDRYQKGNGVERDAAEAASWYRKASLLGNALATFRLSPSATREDLQYLRDAEHLLGLPDEPSREVQVRGIDAIKGFIENDAFFVWPQGTRTTDYILNTDIFENQRPLSSLEFIKAGLVGDFTEEEKGSCLSKGRIAQVAYKAKKLLDFNAEGAAAIGGILALQLKTGFAFLRSYPTTMVELRRVHGQPYPLMLNRKFGAEFVQAKLTGAAVDKESVESLVCAAISSDGTTALPPQDSLSVHCLRQTSSRPGQYVLARYKWHRESACLVKGYESDGNLRRQ